MTSIGIVGAGVAGLHLGLYLRQHGIDTTLYAEKNAEQQLSSRIPALVARVGHTRERERQLGVNHWDGGNNEFSRINIYVAGEQPLSFHGDVDNPFIAVDMRIYLGRLQEEFAARGGTVVVGAVNAGDLERLSEQHDLLVVATGRGGITELFPRIEEESPFSQPQRWIATGLFHGIRAIPGNATVTFVPMHGEVFEFPIFSFEPNMVGLGVEAVPGGAFDEAVHMRYEDDPQRFNAAFLKLLREHVPLIYQRVDPEKFGLTRPLDLMQGGVTPAVRRGYARLGNGKFALAIGDAHITNDPITGQGANTASRVALMLSEQIRSNPVFDESFCRQAEQQVLAYASPVAKWSNAMLQPPQQHMIDLMVAAAQNQTVANAFANFFERPVTAWEAMSSPEGAAAFLQQYGWQTPAAQVAA
jgi:2-polyprenyl-6-methoxyphenol hydroxylase-like FAD-dependent oxidoreductase